MPIIKIMLNFKNSVKINMSRGPETDTGTDIQGHIRPLFFQNHSSTFVYELIR